jgi:hypothetical protein
MGQAGGLKSLCSGGDPIDRSPDNVNMRVSVGLL